MPSTCRRSCVIVVEGRAARCTSAADAGILFDASQNVIDEFPQFPAVFGYEALKEEFMKADAKTNK